MSPSSRSQTHTQNQQKRGPFLVGGRWDKRLTFCYIQVEEVAVEDSLHHTGHDGDHVEETLKVEAPYPVDEVERPVEAQKEQVVRGDGLRLASLADHEQLGEDGH